MSMMINPYVFAAVGGGTLWTPLNMTTVPQIYLDAQDSVVTDVSGACSAISNLGAMGADGDFSQATAGSRPAILAAELNGKRVLSFDGVTDYMGGASAAQLSLTANVNSMWTMAVYKKRLTDVGTESRGLVYISKNEPGTRFGALVGRAASATKGPSLQGRRLDADPFAILDSSVAPTVGAYEMTMFWADYETGAGRIYTDGALQGENLSLFTAGNTSNTNTHDGIGLGATFSGAAPADMDLAAIVMSNTQPSAADIDKLFGWAAHRYGLTANLPIGHPYKTVAPTV